MKTHFPLHPRALMLLLICVLPLSAVRAQNLVQNGTFSDNSPSFVTWPGYASFGGNPAAIANWTKLSTSGVGVNGAAVGFANSPFGPSNSGGNTYAFVQTGSNGLSQVLALTASTLYQLSFDAAVRAGNSALFQVQLGDNNQTYFNSGSLTGNNAAFTHYYYPFTTPGSLSGGASIRLMNLTPGDNTMDFANVVVSAIVPATFTWNKAVSGNASGSWAVQTNWVGGTLPTTTAASVLFSALDITSDSTITLDGNPAIGSLAFGDSNPATPANWILNPGSPASSSLTLGGPNPVIALPSLGTGSAAVINAAIGGTNGLIKTGTSFLQLNAANTYSGGTTLSGSDAHLSVGHDQALGTGLVTLGATPGSGQVWLQAAGNRTLTNNFEIRATRWIIDSSVVNGFAAGWLTVNGNVLLNTGPINANDIFCNQDCTLNGNVSVTPASNPMNKQGIYTLTLNGSNYVSGASTINAGALVVNGPMNGGGSFTVNSGGTLSGTGVLSGTVAVQSGGTVLIGHDGTGTMTVGGYNSRTGGNLIFALGATNNAGNGFLRVNGNLTLSGQLLINDLGGFAGGSYTSIWYSAKLNSASLSVASAPQGRTILIDTNTPHYIIFQSLNGRLSPTAGQAVPMDLAETLSLSWVQSLTAAAYDVYLGTISNSVLVATTNTPGLYLGRTSALTLASGALQPNTTYYWRVDSVAPSGAVTLGAVLSFTTGSPLVDFMEDTWVATDALQRSLPGNTDCGGPRTNRPIGIFYFTWHKNPSGDSTSYYPFGSGTNWDVSQWITAHPFTDPHNPWADSPIFETAKSTYWWGQPELGYYDPRDPWMLRRQIALLSHAGVDVLIFDASNAITYDTEVKALCDMIRQMRFEGCPIKFKVVFLTHAACTATATYLYNSFYSQNKYPELWFYWQGKPLILGYVNGLGTNDLAGFSPAPSATVQNFFTWRQSWAWEGGLDKMAWIDSTTPQQFGYHDAPDHPESTPVTCGGWSSSNIGHSYTNRTQPPYDNYHLPVARTQDRGLFYSEQNAYGLKYDPQFLFVTSWNEWIAGSFAANPAGSVWMLGNPCPLNGYYFVDEYNEEYSRDIEPMKGGHTDNYYFQMVSQNRQRKGARAVPVASAPQTLNVAGDFAQWTNISPAYYDPVNDTVWRNFPSSVAQAGAYTNNTGRNDFTVLKVARDADNFYFLAQCNSNLASYTASNWMVLFIDVDQKHLTGWEGYDFAVNLGARTATTTTLSQNTATNNSWNWTAVRNDLAYQVLGNQLMLAIPRAALGLTHEPVAFDFHWADNFQTNDIADFGVDGDSAPDRRFNYRYQSQSAQEIVLLQDDFESGQQPFWAETWNAGSRWSLTTTAPYSGAHCAEANTSHGSSGGAFVGRADTSRVSNLRLAFHYKLNNVADAQNLNLYYASTNGAWVKIRELSRDEYYPAGQNWSYNEQQNVWLCFTDVRANSGTNAQFFQPGFAFYIDASPLTSGAQSVWIDDVKLSGWVAAGSSSVVKANNSNPLSYGVSWVGGLPPASNSVAIWDSTVSTPNITVSGADLSWAGIQILNPSGPVTINGGNTLTLGAGGIDLSASLQNLTLNLGLSLGATQTWNVGLGQTLAATAGIGGAGPLIKTGAGDLQVNSLVLPNIVVTAGRLVASGSLQGSATVGDGGTIGGNGVVVGPLIVQSGGTLAPGTGIGIGIGTLTVNNLVTLVGTSVFEIQKTGSTLTNDQLAGASSLIYGGTLMVTSLGGTFADGDSFRLFAATNYSGSFTAFTLPALGNGLFWDTSQIAVNGTITVRASPALTAALDGGFFRVLWPTGYAGFELQSQTNVLGVGLSTNWASFPGIISNGVTMPINASNGSVFFRLVLPLP